MWVRMRLSLSGWAVHGSVMTGDIPDGTVTLDVDDEGHSNGDADCLVLSLLVERYLDTD